VAELQGALGATTKAYFCRPRRSNDAMRRRSAAWRREVFLRALRVGRDDAVEEALRFLGDGALFFVFVALLSFQAPLVAAGAWLALLPQIFAAVVLG
jgi:hypothetical protein